MAAPTIVGTPTSGVTASASTVTLGAGLSIVAISTQAQNLPTGTGEIANASSGWTAIVGTKGGAGQNVPASSPTLYLYVFYKVTTNGETISTGDSGVFQAYIGTTWSGYYTGGTPYEDSHSAAGITNGSGVYNLGSGNNPTTTGSDRLVIAFGAPKIDTATAFAGTWGCAGLTGVTQLPAINTASGSGGGLCGFYGTASSAGAVGVSNATDAAHVGINYGYASLAILPASITYTDTVTGTVSLSGTKTESKTGTDAPTGAVSLAGTKTEALSHSASRSGTVSLTGTRSESLTFTDARSGSVPVTGIRSEALTFTDVPSGLVPISGSVVELGPSAHRGRRMFVADPLMTGSPFRSSIDFTE